MSSEWVYIGIFIAVSLIVPIVAVVLPILVSAHKLNKLKDQLYEFGIKISRSIHLQFKAQYYI